MRKIAASYVFLSNGTLLKNGVIVCNNKGTITDIIENKNGLKEEAGLEFYSGILVPGFVNTHCHIELSHLHNKIEEKKGIGAFVGAIKQLRNSTPETIEEAVTIADKKMNAAGIVAVGDISNSTVSLAIKQKSKLFYHTFVESFGFSPTVANSAFDYVKLVHSEFKKNRLQASIVPHSPYSVSQPLFEKIKQFAAKSGSVLSIHNQESPSETQFFKDGTGSIADYIKSNMDIDSSHWKPTGESSLISTLPFLPTKNQLILVHNTFTVEEDLIELKKNRELKNTYFALCPNSNLYIENHLPPVSLFRKHNVNICLGTDSLASNHQLSILSEMITLQQNFPEIELNELLAWSTKNGAKALNIEKEYGSFEKGKTPGINLISGIDFNTMKLTNASRVKKLA